MIILQVRSQKRCPKNIDYYETHHFLFHCQNILYRDNLSSFSDEDGEEGGGDPDLHQCGHCKLMFNNLTKYITHKIQKECWLPHDGGGRNQAGHPGQVVDDELTWSPERNEMSSPDIMGQGKDTEDEHPEQQVHNCLK